jgi:hypothetical protein
LSNDLDRMSESALEAIKSIKGEKK